jgi:hypothetical protein
MAARSRPRTFVCDWGTDEQSGSGCSQGTFLNQASFALDITLGGQAGSKFELQNRGRTKSLYGLALVVPFYQRTYCARVIERWVTPPVYAVKNALFSQKSPSFSFRARRQNLYFGAERRAASAPIVVLSAPKRYK